MELFDSGVIALEPERYYLRDALTIALRSGITVYDSLYVAQATVKGPLLTCKV